MTASCAGGYDLPSDLSEVRLKDNRLVAPAILGEVADMIGMLENDEGGQDRESAGQSRFAVRQRFDG